MLKAVRTQKSNNYKDKNKGWRKSIKKTRRAIKDSHSSRQIVWIINASFIGRKRKAARKRC